MTYSVSKESLENAFEDYLAAEMPGYTSSEIGPKDFILKLEKERMFALFVAGAIFGGIAGEATAEINKQAAARERKVEGKIRRQR